MWKGPQRPTFVSPAASAFSPVPVLINDARERRRGPHLGLVGCCRALGCPPKVPLLPLRSQKSAGGPRALCVLRPGSAPPPRTPRAALWGLPLPWVRPALPRALPRPGGALPQRRALRAASGIGVTSGWRRLPVLATVGSVRPGGSASQSPPSNLPPPPPRLGLVGPALTSRPARSEGGGREGPLPRLRLRPDPRCPFRLCAPTPSFPGTEPPGAPDPRLPLYVAQCSENLGPGGAAGAQREEIRSPRERGPGSLGEGSGAEVRIRDQSFHPAPRRF